MQTIQNNNIIVIDITQGCSRHQFVKERIDDLKEQFELAPNKITILRSGKKKLGSVYLNITYAGNRAFLLMTTYRCGIDAEQVRQLDASKRNTLSKWMRKPVPDDLAFFKQWTKLESTVKYYDDKELFDGLNGQIAYSGLTTCYETFEDIIIAITCDENKTKTPRSFIKYGNI